MNELILDEPEIKNKSPEEEGSIFPFILLIIGFFLTIFFSEFHVLNIFLGGTLLLLNGWVFYSNRIKGIIFTGFLALLASLNIVDFFPFEIIVLFRFDLISSVIFLGSYALVNEKIFFEFLEKRKGVQAEALAPSSKIVFFKKRFKNKTKNELLAILENPSIIEDAKVAAHELLNEIHSG